MAENPKPQARRDSRPDIVYFIGVTVAVLFLQQFWGGNGHVKTI